MTEAKGSSTPPASRYVRAQIRLAIAGAAGLVSGALAAVLISWELAVLVGWDTMSVVVLSVSWWIIRTFDSHDTAVRAKIEDPSRAVTDLVLVSASVTSLVGVGFALFEASGTSGGALLLVGVLAVLTVTLSWLLIHTVYTVRYADLYYSSNGGIDFPGGRQPAYSDFAYLAFTIGMTYQVSDTSLVSQTIRRAALRHALLSYLFGVAIIATTINVVASLLRP
jgi:uncharacterized membrane protein